MPLLKTITELKRYVAIDTKRLLPSFELELRDTETSQLAPLLGPVLLTWLQAQYDAPDFDLEASTLAAQLLRLVQAPLAHFATASGIVVHQASIDETGVHIASNDTSKTAFQWQTTQRQALELSRAYDGLDTLVAWLEEHVEASPELRAWAASKAGQRHRHELFTCTADFQEYENISNSRQVFLALAPQRRKLEALELGRVLGFDFLQELRTQVLTRSLTSENEMLLRTYIYPALAPLTIGFAVPQLGLRLNGDGIDLTIARFDDSNSKEADAGLDALLAQKVQFALLDADRFMRRLTDFLDRTASVTRFATYFASGTYTDPKQPTPIRNTADAKVYKFC
jgi:hypothetical protein